MANITFCCCKPIVWSSVIKMLGYLLVPNSFTVWVSSRMAALSKPDYLILSWVTDLKGSGCYCSLLQLSAPRASGSVLKFLKLGQEKSSLWFYSIWEAVWICAQLSQWRWSSSTDWARHEAPSPSMELLCCCELSKKTLHAASLLFWVILNVVNTN